MYLLLIFNLNVFSLRDQFIIIHVLKESENEKKIKKHRRIVPLISKRRTDAPTLRRTGDLFLKLILNETTFAMMCNWEFIQCIFSNLSRRILDWYIYILLYFSSTIILILILKLTSELYLENYNCQYIHTFIQEAIN